MNPYSSFRRHRRVIYHPLFQGYSIEGAFERFDPKSDEAPLIIENPFETPPHPGLFKVLRRARKLLEQRSAEEIVEKATQIDAVIQKHTEAFLSDFRLWKASEDDIFKDPFEDCTITRTLNHGIDELIDPNTEIKEDEWSEAESFAVLALAIVGNCIKFISNNLAIIEHNSKIIDLNQNKIINEFETNSREALEHAEGLINVKETISAKNTEAINIRYEELNEIKSEFVKFMLQRQKEYKSKNQRFYFEDGITKFKDKIEMFSPQKLSRFKSFVPRETERALRRHWKKYRDKNPDWDR